MSLCPVPQKTDEDEDERLDEMSNASTGMANGPGVRRPSSRRRGAS